MLISRYKCTMNFCLPKINIYVKPDNKNKKEVYIEPTITFATTPEPEKFLELKYEIYSLVHEQTNKKPILRAGWNLKSNKE